MKALRARICAFMKTGGPSLGVGAFLVAGLVLLAAFGLGAWAERPPTAAASPAGYAASGSFANAQKADPQKGDRPKRDTRSSEIAVRLKPGAALPDLSGFGLTDARPLGFSDIYVLDLASAGMPEEDVLARVESLPGVEWAEGEVFRSPCIIPDDTYFSPSSQWPKGQWGSHRVGLPQAWDTTTGAQEVIVAIIDTGLNKDLPDFAGRIVYPCSVEEGEPQTAWPHWQDLHGHGTGVAGVAVAQGNNGTGIAGVAWNVKIMPVKMGNDRVIASVLVRGIEWAVDHGADVINISFTGDESSKAEEEAIRYALDRGVVVVAAGGNKVGQPIGYPAALPGVIGVSATDDRDLLYSSSAGSGLDMAAPGSKIVTYDAQKLRLTHGTSFAAPMVSGVVALMLSIDPGLTPTKVGSILANTAEDLGPPGWDQGYGWGLLDAAKAVGKVAAEASTTTSTTTPPLPNPDQLFRDVSDSNTPYVRQIETLARLSVVNGVGEGLFRPGSPVYRQQFAKMVVLTLGHPVSTADTAPFTDVERGKDGGLYPYHHVAVAWKKGITRGVTTTLFDPYKNITRAQMITMVARAVDFPEPPAGYKPPFSDFSKEHYPSARRAAYAGALSTLEGMGPGYDFFAPASRGEVCALLYEVLP